jgi:hypothetical protein
MEAAHGSLDLRRGIGQGRPVGDVDADPGDLVTHLRLEYGQRVRVPIQGEDPVARGDEAFHRGSADPDGSTGDGDGASYLRHQ